MREKLKKRRANKRAAVTRRIKEIIDIINAGGSRRKVSELLKFLLTLRPELETLDQEVERLDEDHDELWIEHERERLDTVQADVAAYLESRADDPPSTASLTEEWVQQHAPGINNTSSLDDEDGSKQEDGASVNNVVPSLAGHYPSFPRSVMSVTAPDYVPFAGYAPFPPHHLRRCRLLCQPTTVLALQRRNPQCTSWIL